MEKTNQPSGGPSDAGTNRLAEVPRDDLETAVCIVGAGFAGLITAYLLTREGVPTLVLDTGTLEDDRISSGTAHLSSARDLPFGRLERVFGRSATRLVGQCRTRAIDLIEKVVLEENFACGFRRVDGYLLPAAGQRWELVIEEMLAAQRAGVNVEMAKSVHGVSLAGPFALRFPQQACIEPERFRRQLIAVLLRDGSRVLKPAGEVRITEAPTPKVEIADGPGISARFVVVTDDSLAHLPVVLRAKLVSRRAYALALRVRRGDVQPPLFWDFDDPGHYLESGSDDDGHDTVVIGSHDRPPHLHSPRTTPFAALEAWAREMVPTLGAVAQRRSHYFSRASDGLPFIGHMPGSGATFVACGFWGPTLTPAAMAGMRLSDLVLGRSHPCDPLFDPARRTTTGTGEFIVENASNTMRYLEWLHPHLPASRLPELAPTCGRVEQRGFRKVAAFRDAAGRLYEFSAVCPHRGCILVWNKSEHSWDCRCRGSRFGPTGRLLRGPATADLTLLNHAIDVVR